MANRKWVKPYKYVDVPVFFRRWDLFGFSIIIQSHKTKKRRVGAIVSSDKVWDLYEDLLTPKRKIGESGFSQLTYRGVPVVEREDFPKSHVGFIDREHSKIRLLNWKTGKKSKLMTWDEFDAWMKKENKKLRKLAKKVLAKK